MSEHLEAEKSVKAIIFGNMHLSYFERTDKNTST